MSVRIVRLGTARGRNEGTRIGTVRHPPRGVPKDQHAAQNWYDAWLPELAPSTELLKLAQSASSDKEWAAFVKRYRADDGGQPEKQRLLQAAGHHVAGVDTSRLVAICADESRCHRSVLRELLRECGAALQ